MNAGATSVRVYEALRQRIMDHEFGPGVRLDPAALAEQLASSTTPVREALYELLGEKLVETRSGGGFFIPLLDEPALKDLYAWSGELIALSVRSWPKGSAMLDLEQIRSEPPEQRVGPLFHAISMQSRNREHALAVDGLNARLQAVRGVEAQVIGEMDAELSMMEGAASRADREALRKLSASYHRRRRRSAARIVRALYRSG